MLPHQNSLVQASLTINIYFVKTQYMLLYWINQNLNSWLEWKLWANVKILWVAEGAQNVQCVLCLGQGCSKSSFRRCSQLEKFTIHYISQHLCPCIPKKARKQGRECSDDVANKLGPNWIQMAISQTKTPCKIWEIYFWKMRNTKFFLDKNILSN